MTTLLIISWVLWLIRCAVLMILIGLGWMAWELIFNCPMIDEDAYEKLIEEDDDQ